MVLGLDISTSNVGYTILDKNDFDNLYLVEAGCVELKKIKCFYEKVDKIKEALDNLSQYNIKHILVEKSLQKFAYGKSSSKTIAALSKMNGVVRYLSYSIFNILPEEISATTARRIADIKIEKESKKDSKDIIFENILKRKEFKEFVWPTKTFKSGPRKGKTEYAVSCYDIADSAVLCYYYYNR